MKKTPEQIQQAIKRQTDIVTNNLAIAVGNAHEGILFGVAVANDGGEPTIWACTDSEGRAKQLQGQILRLCHLWCYGKRNFPFEVSIIRFKRESGPQEAKQ